MTKVNREEDKLSIDLRDRLGWITNYKKPDEVERVITSILDLFSQTRNDLLREIMEEMPKPRPENDDEASARDNVENEGFNRSLYQVNTLLESKLSTVKK